ncbi:uncharacterized protein PAC_17846 [Phialocephala subalpina]|uniref:AB hydrolase-1 domain-containing protein n=1 Tax=Phialocephala subalpina TaxID=576137 RepID=A0A1L7XSK1_9HELO|nr:uncharacterized protein PAC_17846 [Phialocephala subalpina]
MIGIIKRTFYDAPPSQIHYRYILTSVNAKKELVVFMHQSASCEWCYESMMKEYSERGHDCYAPDMPGFGGSYDPAEDPTSTRYYVEIYMGLFCHLHLPKMHLVGHHSGAALALEMRRFIQEEIFTCTLSAPALATPEEQGAMFKTLAAEWSKPKEDGSHLTKA